MNIPAKISISEKGEVEYCILHAYEMPFYILYLNRLGSFQLCDDSMIVPYFLFRCQACGILVTMYIYEMKASNN